MTKFGAVGDDRYVEEPKEELVDEFAFTEFVPKLRGSYFGKVHQALTVLFPIARFILLIHAVPYGTEWRII
jgi:hypothetical protein